MKSFKQYITELFDSPVKVKKIQTIGKHHHVYMFKVNNVPYHVNVHHLFASPNMADVDFNDRSEKPEDSMTTTGKQGHNASGVLAGVHAALRKHQKENPHVDTYLFDASTEKDGDVNPARTRLYGAIAKRAGGKAYGNSFRIPSSALKEEFDPEAIKIANSTSRNSGAVGAKAITPRYVQSVAKKDHKILDFGSGKDAAHAKRLRDEGLDVTAHEFGSNQNENHDPDALKRQYDHVYASNVLNVQSSKEMLGKTLDQIHGAVKKGGAFTGNFPESPRKAADIDAAHVENELKNRFSVVKRVGGSKKAPLFHATDPK